MQRRIALVQYDKAGCVLQAATCFVDCNLQQEPSVADVLGEIRLHCLSSAVAVDAIFDAGGDIYRVEGDFAKCPIVHLVERDGHFGAGR